MTTWINSKGQTLEATPIDYSSGWIITVDGVEVSRGQVSTVGNHRIIAAMAGKYGIPHAQYKAMCDEAYASTPADVIANRAAIKALVEADERMDKVMRG
jgi:hypothetical protein